MKHVSSCIRCAQLGGGAAVTVALAMSLVTAPPERVSVLPVGSHLVQLQAATASALTNSSALEVASMAGSPGDSIATGVQADRSAAATAEESFWSSPIGTALILLDLASLPIWFLFTPITLPVSMLAAASQTDTASPFSTLQFLILTAMGFLTGPMGVLSILAKPSSTPAAAVGPRAVASAAATGLEATVPSPAAALAAPPALSSNASAAAGDGTDALTQIGRTIASVAGWALSPIWYLAFPITTTIWDLAIAPLFPNFPRFQGIPFFAMFPSSWFVPFQLADILFPTATSPKANPFSGAAVRPAASINDGTDAHAVSTDAIATQSHRRGQTLRDNGSRRPSVNASAANSKRSAVPSSTAKTSGAASKRNSAR